MLVPALDALADRARHVRHFGGSAPRGRASRRAITATGLTDRSARGLDSGSREVDGVDDHSQVVGTLRRLERMNHTRVRVCGEGVANIVIVTRVGDREVVFNAGGPMFATGASVSGPGRVVRSLPGRSSAVVELRLRLTLLRASERLRN